MFENQCPRCSCVVPMEENGWHGGLFRVHYEVHIWPQPEQGTSIVSWGKLSRFLWFRECPFLFHPSAAEENYLSSPMIWSWKAPVNQKSPGRPRSYNLNPGLLLCGQATWCSCSEPWGNTELDVRTLLEMGIFLVVASRRYNDLGLKSCCVRWAAHELGWQWLCMTASGGQSVLRKSRWVPCPSVLSRLYGLLRVYVIGRKLAAL